ncbi:MAG: Arc family DNA-binding protein [Pseudomonadota bacterium]
MSARKPFALRLSQQVHEAMQRWADDELRSLNAQIEYVLRDQLRKHGRLAKDGQEQRKPEE